MQREQLHIENVVQRKLGYLKVPQAFRDTYGSPVHFPEPTNVSRAEHPDIVFLIYEFPKSEMEKLRKKDSEVKA
jgi:hypothetical protein